jgi:hypothetical protein
MTIYQKSKILKFKYLLTKLTKANENFYFNPKWRDESWWAPRYEFYCTLSGVIACLVVWRFAKFSKRYL